MARVTIVEDELRVELQGMHKIWALKNTISVPMAHVVGATADPEIAKESKVSGHRAHTSLASWRRAAVNMTRHIASGA